MFSSFVDPEGKKVKISVSIIGDAFADLFCYLENSTMPVYGGDVRLSAPLRAVPGGTGLNTATHLHSLIDYFDNDEEGKMNVTLQTVLNESDDFGRLIIDHALKHGFRLINCFNYNSSLRGEESCRSTIQSDSSDDNEGNIDDNKSSQSISRATGHCIVVVSQGLERSFMTHLGVMGSFQAKDTILHELINCSCDDPTFNNHHHHIHIAGYYNIPGFWNGKMKRRLSLVLQKRRSRSLGSNVYTTTTSLVPQYDASEEWGGDIVGLLPLIDFFILNSLEAGKICGIVIDTKDGGSALNRAVVFLQMAKVFHSMSPNTYIIVTLGSKGAIALFGGKILNKADCPKSVDVPVDPTGAGDAFAAGFLKGVMAWRAERMHYQCEEIGTKLTEDGGDDRNRNNGYWFDSNDPDLSGSWTEAVAQGMRWGCAMGSAVVMQLGASSPPPKAMIQKYMGVDGDGTPELEVDGANVKNYTSAGKIRNEDENKNGAKD